MVRRILVFVAVTSMVLAMGAIAASAGEITGKGTRPMVVGVTEDGHTILHAKSACAFSGLNDDPTSTELFDGGRVQSFGDIVQEAIGVFGDGKGASALVPLITGDGPGANCRGNADSHGE